MIDEKKAKGYVYCDVERYVSWDGLTTSLWAPIVFPLFTLIYAIFEKMIFLAIVLPILHIVWSIAVFWFGRISRKINTFSLRFLVSGIVVTYLSILMLLMVMFVVVVGECSPMCYVFLIGGWLLCAILYNGYILLMINRGRYVKKVSPPRKGAVILIGIFLLCGVVLIKTFLTEVESMIVAGTFVSYGCIMGTQHFLKYYFSKKYGFNADEDGENSSPLLIPPTGNTGDGSMC